MASDRVESLSGAWEAPRVSHGPLLGGAVAGLVIGSFAIFGLQPRAFIVAFTAGVLVVLAAVDLQQRVLPNRIVLPAAAIVLIAQVAFYPERASEWVLAALAAAGFLAAPMLIRRDAMGMGDVKLALLLGAAVGWKVFVAITLGCLAILPVALVLASRRSLRGATVPFGPFLAFGTLLIMYGS